MVKKKDMMERLAEEEKSRQVEVAEEVLVRICYYITN
jgi:hypothetical protein